MEIVVPGGRNRQPHPQHTNGGGPSFSDFGGSEARSSNPPSPGPNPAGPSSSHASSADAAKYQQELLVADNWILDVLRTFGRAVMFMNQYDSKAAVAELDQLLGQVRERERVVQMPEQRREDVHVSQAIRIDQASLEERSLGLRDKDGVSADESLDGQVTTQA